MRILLYGGAFNPPGLQHVRLLSRAIARLRVDEVWIIPAWGHAFGKVMAGFEDRVALCEATFPGRLDAPVKVCPIEREIHSQNTLQLIQEINRRHPEDHFVWLMGSDEWNAFHRWHKPEELRQILDILVLDRGHGSSTEIRNALAQGAEAHPDLTPEAREIISVKGLYRD